MEKGLKRLIDCTLDELDDFLQSRGYRREPEEIETKTEEPFCFADYKREDLLFGDAELAQYLGITQQAVSYRKKMGWLDGTFTMPTPHRFIYFKDRIDRMYLRPKKKSPATGVADKPAREGR